MIEMTEAQEIALRGLCARYKVEYDPSHYVITPRHNTIFMPGFAEGWVGGLRHANPQYAKPQEPAGPPTIYVGVSPEGEVHS